MLKKELAGQLVAGACAINVLVAGGARCCPHPEAHDEWRCGVDLKQFDYT